jgi:hypothetical protein
MAAMAIINGSMAWLAKIININVINNGVAA